MLMIFTRQKSKLQNNLLAKRKFCLMLGLKPIENIVLQVFVNSDFKN